MDAVRQALDAAGLPAPSEVQWEIPREARHGDYATNVAMALARDARRPPRKIAEAIVAAFPRTAVVDRVELAGPGFLNVFLLPPGARSALHEVLAAGDELRPERRGQGRAGPARVRLRQSHRAAVIVNARAAAVGDALARILRAQGYAVESQYYVNDAGNQFTRSRARWTCACARRSARRPSCPRTRYPGEYLVDLVAEWLARDPAGMRATRGPPGGRAARAARAARGGGHGGGPAPRARGLRHRLRRVGPRAARRARARRGRASWPSSTRRGHTYEQDGALWFRSTDLRRRQGPRAPPLGRGADLLRGGHRLPPLRQVRRAPTTSSTSSAPTTTATSSACGRRCRPSGTPRRPSTCSIVQLVTLLRDGQPVRMSKRRGEFVLMEELLEEVGRDAARFTFLTRRHDSPLEFDLAVATRQSADNPVFYVQYAHARVGSLFKNAAEQGIADAGVEPGGPAPARLDEEQALIKRLLQYPDLVAGAARAREPHRVAYFLPSWPASFTRTTRATGVIVADRALTLARLGLCAAVAQVVATGSTCSASPLRRA